MSERLGTCAECGDVFVSMARTGRPAHRCPACRDTRKGSSPDALAIRLKAVSEAIRQRDETAVRGELRLLADEAGRLAQQPSIWQTPLERRVMVAAEGDPTRATG